jgi:ABC-type branched-subunit amino acid transport system substrate-binding protein
MIIGPPSTAGIAGILDQVTAAGVVLFSPSAAGKGLGTDDRGLFVRLTPSDELQGSALADVVTGEGVLSVTVVAERGDAGEGLVADLAAGLEGSGGSIAATVLFDAADPAAPATVAAVTAAPGDARVFLGDTQPVSELLAALLDAGASPTSPPWFAANLTAQLGAATR